MNPKVETLLRYRQFVLAQIERLTDEQLNQIPKGFNNNIIWNLGHILCAQQGLCYKRAGLPITVDDQYVTPFLTGTKPTAPLASKDIEAIKTLLIKSLDTLNQDLEQLSQANYEPSPNIFRVYNIEINNIDEALDFLLYHEGYHTGSILALKRLVQ